MNKNEINENPDLYAVGSSPSVFVERTDNEIDNDLRVAFGHVSEIDTSSLQIAVENQEVFLSGSVPTEEARDLLLGIARNIQGVREVYCDCRIV